MVAKNTQKADERGVNEIFIVDGKWEEVYDDDSSRQRVYPG